MTPVHGSTSVVDQLSLMSDTVLEHPPSRAHLHLLLPDCHMTSSIVAWMMMPPPSSLGLMLHLHQIRGELRPSNLRYLMVKVQMMSHLCLLHHLGVINLAGHLSLRHLSILLLPQGLHHPLHSQFLAHPHSLNPVTPLVSVDHLRVGDFLLQMHMYTEIPLL